MGLAPTKPELHQQFTSLMPLLLLQVSASNSMKPDLRDIHSIPAGKVDAVLDQVVVPDNYPHFTPFVENKSQVCVHALLSDYALGMLTRSQHGSRWLGCRVSLTHQARM